MFLHVLNRGVWVTVQGLRLPGRLLATMTDESGDCTSLVRYQWGETMDVVQLEQWFNCAEVEERLEYHPTDDL